MTNTETLALSPEELKDYIVDQTINHGLEVQRKNEEIKLLKSRLLNAYRLLLGYEISDQVREYITEEVEKLESR